MGRKEAKLIIKLKEGRKTNFEVPEASCLVALLFYYKINQTLKMITFY